MSRKSLLLHPVEDALAAAPASDRAVGIDALRGEARAYQRPVSCGLRPTGNGIRSDGSEAGFGGCDVRKNLISVADACPADAPLAVQDRLLELCRERQQRLAWALA